MLDSYRHDIDFVPIFILEYIFCLFEFKI